MPPSCPKCNSEMVTQVEDTQGALAHCKQCGAVWCLPASGAADDDSNGRPDQRT